MDLKALSSKRIQWQTDALNKISQSINLDLADVDIMNSDGTTKNVIVFGMTQAGKTCSILAIAGISFEYQNHVENMLRAGQERGSSSTSTAIIYRKTIKNKFGLSYVSNGTALGKPIFYDDEEFKNKLVEVRKKVEANQHPDDCLVVYIPTKYYNKSKNYNFNIIDLPGAGSRNKDETVHVEMLRARYFDTAHVKIIVCSIEDVQSLQNDNDMVKLLPYEDVYDWTSLSSEYMLVLTSSYSMESIKKYFATPKKREGRKF